MKLLAIMNGLEAATVLLFALNLSLLLLLEYMPGRRQAVRNANK